MKPGIKTTEFWITAFSQIIGILVLSGKLTPDQGVSLQSAGGQTISALIDLVTTGYMLFTVITYVVGRSNLKIAHITGGTTEKKDITISNTVQPVPPPQM